MKFTEKQKIILAILVFGLLIGGLVALNVLKFRHRSDLLAKIDGLKSEEERANEKIKRIPELREKRANLANIIDQYAEILPKEEHTQHDAFVEIIDGYRRDTQIVIQRVEYLKPKTETAADDSSDLDDKSDADEIAKARIPYKDIELTVSTYTYSKGEGEKK